MANIRDVAKKAGVGIATVSRCINNDGYVSDDVRKKIQSAIEELNYTPNALARALFTKSSMMIGLIIPSIVNPVYPELAVGIENRAKEKGYSIVLSNTEYQVDNEKSIIDMFKQHRVDGIIVANAKCNKEYTSAEFPVVAIEKRISKNITFLGSDNYKGGTLVADYIISNNLSRILHIKGPENIASANERYKGFKDTLDRAEKSFDVIEGIYGEDILDIGRDLSNYEVVFVWNDDLAISLLSECYKVGLRVPDDIEVIGFDNIYYSNKTSPSLTTVSQSISAMGEVAVDLLVNQIEDKTPLIEEHIFDVELIARNSTKH